MKVYCCPQKAQVFAASRIGAAAAKGATKITVNIRQGLASEKAKQPFDARQTLLWPGVVGDDALGVEGENVSYRDFSGITSAFPRSCRVLAVEVSFKCLFSSATVCAAALCALLVSTIDDEPDGRVGDTAPGVPALSP
jgi:hypothetical protein